jgi:hypothetical protein
METAIFIETLNAVQQATWFKHERQDKITKCYALKKWILIIEILF